MNDFPLRLHAVTYRAEEFFADKPVVIRRGTARCTTTYGAVVARARQLADALRGLGLRTGDRVGTLQWNQQEHLECYLGVPNGGMVLHTLNFRLFADDLAHVIEHARDRVLIVDDDQLPLLHQSVRRGTSVEHVVLVGDGASPDDVDLPGVACHRYEDLLSSGSAHAPWADVDEKDAAGLCYTSATTGRPKGVVYTHRSQFLHTLAICCADALAISERDTILPVAPFFHANAWGLPLAATWMGSTLALPGRHPSFGDVADIIESERVTLAAGVPTVWVGVLSEQDEHARDFTSLRNIMSGGSAVPRALAATYEERWGTVFIQPYGMTEASPITHISRVRSTTPAADKATQLDQRSTQGVLLPGLEMRLVTEERTPVPHDGTSVGEVMVRGPWVACEYERDDRSAIAFSDGWYRTGDVARVDPHGYVTLVDRVADLVKSGGEWISSVALENALMASVDVHEAAVVARPDARWSERPVAFVVPTNGATTSAEDLLAELAPLFPSFWLPDEIYFVDEIPKTGVGKFSKRDLRATLLNGNGNGNGNGDGDGNGNGDG